MSKLKTETVVRFCKCTGKLVLAEVMCDFDTQMLCMHNDNIKEDQQQVVSWLKEHGLETLE